MIEVKVSQNYVGNVTPFEPRSFQRRVKIIFRMVDRIQACELWLVFVTQPVIDEDEPVSILNQKASH